MASCTSGGASTDLYIYLVSLLVDLANPARLYSPHHYSHIHAFIAVRIRLQYDLSSLLVDLANPERLSSPHYYSHINSFIVVHIRLQYVLLRHLSPSVACALSTPIKAPGSSAISPCVRLYNGLCTRGQASSSRNAS